uniref:Reverse transcriptase RNase H-like domain-containing protein n=1 Tax=Amphimedon queenslandica TaxID=400682 RepID=A0A1X7SDC8_AMPQE
MGAVMQQWIDETWQPLAYFSRPLKPPEKKYSTFDRDLLGIYLAIQRFCYSLEDRQFYVLSDHKHLTHLHSFHSNQHSPQCV